MASIYKRPESKFWMAKFFDANGDRVGKSTGTTKKREAQRIANQFEADERDRRAKAEGLPRMLAAILDAGVREAQTGDLTLARLEDLLRRAYQVAHPDFRVVSVCGWYREWINQQSEYVGDSAQRGYENDLALLKTALGSKKADMPLATLTADDLRAALAKAHKRVSAATANKMLRSFRRACEAAVSGKLISANVAAQVRPLPQDDSTVRTAFTVAEVRALLAEVDQNAWLARQEVADEWHGLILLGAYTGLRLSDLLRLERKHLSEDGTTLHLAPEKTARSKRTIKVPLTPAGIAWIGARGGQWFRRLAKQKKGTTSTQFQRLMEKAGVARDVPLAGDLTARRSFHSLRHSFTSWLADADVHSDVRQRLTGHSSAGIHAKYSHHDESLRRAVACLPTP